MGRLVTTAPYDFQNEDERTIHKAGGRILVANEPGLGKSFLSLLYAKRRLGNGLIVVVCPATIKFQWAYESSHHVQIRGEVLEGIKPPESGFHTPKRLLILNYEILYAWVDYLIELKPQLLVIDECHRVSNHRARCYKAAKKLSLNVPHILPMSGTPLLNRAAELWTILNILHPKKFPSYWSFAMTYGAPKRVFGRWTFPGTSNANRLHRVLKPLMIRRLKRDVLTQLPDKQRTIVPLDIRKRKTYEKAIRSVRTWLQGGQHTHIERKTKFMELKQLAAWYKMESAIEWIDDFLENNDSKLIVFGWHTKILKRLQERYRNSVLVNGSVVGKARKLAIEKFLHDKQTRLFIGNLRAAGVGWSAKGVSNVAFVEVGWNASTQAQAEDRCHGLNRGEAGKGVNCYYLLAKDTVETTIYKLLQTKQKHANAIMDGKGKGDSFDIYDRLTRELLRDDSNGKTKKSP